MIEPDRKLGSWLIRQGISCPLRMIYLMESQHRESEVPYHRHLKRVMYRALRLTRPGGRVASRDPVTAARQTEEWVRSPDAIIYGGIIAWKTYRARIPLLLRRDEQLELFQIHGKLWKSAGRTLGREHLLNGSFLPVIREAAYRKWLLTQVRPELELNLTLCFPNANFRAECSGLYDRVASGVAQPEDVEGLFVNVDASEAVDALIKGEGEPYQDLHTWFNDSSFDHQLQMLGSLVTTDRTPPFQVTRACKACRFRTDRAISEDRSCWDLHLKGDGDWHYPDKHVYELVGVGNDQEIGQQNHLQEEVPLHQGLDTFQKVKEASRETITMQQRRVLQLLSARDLPVPQHWFKRDLLRKVRHLRWPLHFLDFESATSPVPLASGAGPYQPVVFQYSCHTLYEDGRLEHHHWLDSDRTGETHKRLSRKLLSIPDIFRGTILHYSPFEKQVLKKLWRDSVNGPDPDPDLADRLRTLYEGDVEGSVGSPGERYCDMGAWVRDYYYNMEMSSGLGLKEVLYSVLKTSPVLQSLYGKPLCFDGEEITLVRWEGGTLSDPYHLMGDESAQVMDGASAMYAWLHARTATCPESERNRIHRALRRYCMLDTLALVMLCQHFISYADRASGDEDLVIRAM